MTQHSRKPDAMFMGSMSVNEHMLLLVEEYVRANGMGIMEAAVNAEVAVVDAIRHLIMGFDTPEPEAPVSSEGGSA